MGSRTGHATPAPGRRLLRRMRTGMVVPSACPDRLSSGCSARGRRWQSQFAADHPDGLLNRAVGRGQCRLPGMQVAQ